MSWQDDQADAFDHADDLGIDHSELQNWHDISDWSWEDIADRLEIQAEYAAYYDRDESPPDWLIDAYYEYEDWDNVPDWMTYYHDS